MVKSIKGIALSIATFFSCLTIMPLTAYADYDYCDVNHDNSVNMADAVCILNYLNGNLYCYNYNQLDANRDLFIDIKDKECVQAKILNLYYNTAYYSRASGNICASPSVSGFIPDGAASATSSRYYWDHSYVTNNTSSYYLTPSSNQMSSLSTSDVEYEIDENMDLMYPANGIENTGIVYLNDIGTGFIVGDHEIATAAHCVYNTSNNSWYSMSIDTYDENGNLTGNNLTPIECHIPVEYPSYTATEYDYAVITVAEDLSDHFIFNIGASYNVNETNYSSIPIYLTGCPAQVHHINNSYSLNTNHKLYSDEGHIVDITVSDPSIITYFSSDYYPGQSGSPVYTISHTTIGNTVTVRCNVLAIFHGGIPGNYGTGSRITKYHLQFYNNNSHLDY